MSIKYYADVDGNYVGAYNQGNPLIPSGSTEIDFAPEHGKQVWSYTDNEWQYTKDVLKEHLSYYRWQKETGGILSQGYLIDTSDRSKTLLAGLYNHILSLATPTATQAFKTGTGWQDITHANLELIALDVARHAEKCFEAEKLAETYIDNNEDTNFVDVEVRWNAEFAGL